MKTLIMMMLVLTVLLTFNSSANAVELTITEGRVRLVPPVADNSAAYLTLINRSDKPITLTTISSPICRHILMHHMIMVDDRMEMQAIKQISIPAGGHKRFLPGGDHIMLMGLHHPLHSDDKIVFILHYADNTTQRITLSVVDMR